MADNKGFTLPEPVNNPPENTGTPANPPANGTLAVTPAAEQAVIGMTNTKDIAIASGLLLVMLIVLLVVRSNYATWRVRNRVAPSQANASGWFLFLGLTALGGIPLLGFVSSALLGPLYTIPLGALTALCLIACIATFSPRKN